MIYYAKPIVKEVCSMSGKNNYRRWDTFTLTGIGVMAALVYVLTFFRFPLMDSKVHFANAMCLLAGLLLGPVPGGLAAGLGSALYDLLSGGYGPVDALITFVSKFIMAYVCALIAGSGKNVEPKLQRVYVSGIVGALTYVALYMAKSLFYALFVNVIPAEALGVKMISKLVPSLLNAVVAMVAAPVFYHAVWPAMRRILSVERRQHKDAGREV